MFPHIFEIPESVPLVGGFILRSFGVMVLLGVLAGAWWLGKAFRVLGVPGEDPVGAAVMRAALWGFLGARLLYVVVHPDVLTDLVAPIALWRGGLVSYGGFLGGTFGAWLFARKVKLPFLRLADAFGPGLLLGQALGRIGCLLVGDDHGSPWDGPWAITFQPTAGSLIPPELYGVPLHPSQLYLSAMNFVLFAITARMFLRRRFEGQVAAATIVLYSVGRFLLEFTRGDDQARGYWGALSTAQWISLATFAAGLWIWRHQRTKASARVAPA